MNTNNNALFTEKWWSVFLEESLTFDCWEVFRQVQALILVGLQNHSITQAGRHLRMFIVQPSVQSRVRCALRPSHSSLYPFSSRKHPRVGAQPLSA